MINNLKGHVIDNDVHTFGSKCHLRLSNDTSASGDGNIVISTPQVYMHAHANFLFGSRVFYKKMEINLVG